MPSRFSKTDVVIKQYADGSKLVRRVGFSSLVKIEVHKRSDPAKYKYQCHRALAVGRGIEFNLTYEEWLKVWGDKLERQGNRRGECRMTRIDSSKPFSIENVKIVCIPKT